MQKKNSFTLIEILTTIAIIAILVGLLLSAIIGVKAKAIKVKVRTQINNLQTSISAFQKDYNGKLPLSTTVADGVELNDAQYQAMILILQNREPDTTPPTPKVNKRGIDYLNIEKNTPGVYLDDWDARFHVRFDTNGDGKINGNYRKMEIWSNGENETDDGGSGDDIISWDK